MCLNDATVEVLVGQALNQAAAGADIIAPSEYDGWADWRDPGGAGGGGAWGMCRSWLMRPNMPRRFMVRFGMQWGAGGC